MKSRKTEFPRNRAGAVLVAGVLMGALATPPEWGVSNILVPDAHAQQGGGQGQHGGGPGDTPRGGGVGGRDASADASSSSATKMGRLNMARAFVAPGFDISRVDDPLAPIAQVALAVELLSSPLSSTDDIDAAGTAIGNAATVIPITEDTVSRLMDLAGTPIDASWTTSLAAVAAVATQVVEDRRSDEPE